ncbi:hypothetical protein AKJ09_00594 [Labilithrix luteola]|uniref:Uncharacterized protein n=1 Tax=Labilithrix luteola TaxID=1391654 RepID=A0A0K1PK76_9BACT|nr:hypothetical protein AKJ09_00594 [Labilithrix luteola]
MPEAASHKATIRTLANSPTAARPSSTDRTTGPACSRLRWFAYPFFGVADPFVTLTLQGRHTWQDVG